ncbi:MAG: hypothetical protein H6701_11365 [Myxococcales bacterium]|nr:hypothetical protein [Myxococcales bacterium]
MDAVHIGQGGATPAPAAVGFGVDLGYTQRRVATARPGDAVVTRTRDASAGLSLDFAFAVKALPQGPDGAPDPDALVNAEQKEALSAALDRLVREGRGGAAEADFQRAVDALFDEYGRDLGFADHELAAARGHLVGAVDSFFDQVESIRGEPLLQIEEVFPLPLADALAELRDRLLSRRQDVLEASGDLGRVLAERVVEARDGGRPEALADLGHFVERLQEAASARSSRALRADAKNRLLQDLAPASAPDPTAVAQGAAFLAHLAAR